MSEAFVLDSVFIYQVTSDKHIWIQVKKSLTVDEIVGNLERCILVTVPLERFIQD